MKAAVASVIAAGAASVCCIGPVVLVLVGAGAVGASLASVERYRPIFLTITAAFLGFAFYAAYRQKDDCGPCSPATRRRTKMTVWFAAVLVIVLVAFPYYVGFMF